VYIIAIMVNIVIVTKEGKLKDEFEQVDNLKYLYKKAGFKKGDGFVIQTEWKVNDTIIQLFGKKYGNAGYENKYDFPPPVDNVLFFGSCVIIAFNQSGEMVNMTIPLWKKIYEHLFGGFEDLTLLDDDDDEEDICELSLVPKHLKTKQGYLKDGFVVDSSETEDNFSSCEEESEDN